MRLQGALIKEQGVTFAVVIVKQHVLDNPNEANQMIAAMRPVFPGLPVILMAQDYQGEPTYYGRKDLAQFMANVPMECVPWAEYSIA